MEKVNKESEIMGRLVGVGKEYWECVLPEIGKLKIEVKR